MHCQRENSTDLVDSAAQYFFVRIKYKYGDDNCKMNIHSSYYFFETTLEVQQQ